MKQVLNIRGKWRSSISSLFIIYETSLEQTRLYIIKAVAEIEKNKK